MLQELKNHYIATLSRDIPDDLADLRDEIAEFCLYPNVGTWGIDWAEENNDFMAYIGLPASAPTMINFNDSVVVEDEWIYIGHNNYGDKIVILKKTGEVAYINHDSSDRVQYMNKDAISMFRSIVAYTEAMKGTGSLATSIAAFDPKALEDDAWWKQNEEL